MNIPFWKMQGAGNDFVLVDDRNQSFPAQETDWLRQIGSRRLGVGCEGIILIQPSREADFRMRFFNPDGSEVDMCGNGARCVARLAHEIGAAQSSMSIETQAGRLRADVKGHTVRLGMTNPFDWNMEGLVTVADASLAYASVNSGVPHVVVGVDDLDGTDVVGLGRAIRRHVDFAPQGTNANFIAITGPHSLRIRTYERGVEDETLACGTGIVASALIAARQGDVAAPVKVLAKSGDTLIVDFRLTDTGAENVTLEGPAEHVFRGTLEYAG
ncbi:MAG: diaminopimelate epimerase [Verrucomicrobia bacterium]|nr:diaminopimelate epimerase [Verrucomicrobiota bacterium]